MDYRSAVIQQIQQSHTKNPFIFGIVAGDNVYPHKPLPNPDGTHPKKIKHYYLKTLTYGNHKLQAAVKGAPLYYALGNHDVVKQEVMDYHRTHWMKDGTQYIKWISQELLVVVVDTNLLQKNITETIQRHYQIKTPQEGFQVIQRFLQEAREECVKRAFQGFTVIVGHEPLLSVKQTIDADSKIQKLKIDSLVLYDELLIEMLQFPNPIYLCADVHAFQVWNMNTEARSPQARSPKAAPQARSPKAMPMVIVGTGGASPDKNPEHPVIHLKHFEGERMKGLKPELVESQSSYGFAEIDIEKDRLRLRFRPLKYCMEGQYDALYEYQKGHPNIKSVTRASARTVFPYDPEKCKNESGVRETSAHLCRITDAPMDGGGRYNRVMNTVMVAEYIVYQGHRYRIHRDSQDRRRKYIVTRSGRIYAPHYHTPVIKNDTRT